MFNAAPTKAKYILHTLVIMLCIYIILICAGNLNELLFHSYKTSKVLWPFDNKHFLDIDLLVKYSAHFWHIISQILVVVVLAFGAIWPYFIKLYQLIKLRICKHKDLSTK